jgi:hypothetical protein
MLLAMASASLCARERSNHGLAGTGHRVFMRAVARADLRCASGVSAVFPQNVGLPPLLDVADAWFSAKSGSLPGKAVACSAGALNCAGCVPKKSQRIPKKRQIFCICSHASLLKLEKRSAMITLWRARLLELCLCRVVLKPAVALKKRACFPVGAPHSSGYG